MFIIGNPVPGPRIVPFGEERSSGDVLFNGRPAFKVTQRFDDVNPALPHLGKHRALDLGNFNCGDAVLAAATGTARTMRDSAGALIVIIRHGDGYETVYAHLGRFAIPEGTSTAVLRGQTIGVVGASGLGSGCHLHFEVKLNGAHLDPWPLLPQNKETTVTLQGFKPIINRRVVLKAGATARSTPNFNPRHYDENKIATHAGSVNRVAVAEVKGSNLTLVDGKVFDPSTRWVMTDSESSNNIFYHWRDIESFSVIETKEVIKEVIKEVPTGITQTDLKNAVAAERKLWADPLRAYFGAEDALRKRVIG